MTEVVYVGHATVLIETGGKRILTDPLLRSRLAHLHRVAPLPQLPGLTSPDAVLISHAHLDHLDLSSLRSLRTEGPVILPKGHGFLRRRIRHDVVEIEEGDRVPVGAVEVLATHAAHDGRRFPPLGRPKPAQGFVIDGDARVYFAGDTDLFPGMADIGGALDLALLPVAGWGPRLPPGHLDPERAARATALLRPRVAVPIHWGTFATRSAGAADLEHPARDFARLVASHAPEVEVRILRPGEATSLEDHGPRRAER